MASRKPYDQLLAVFRDACTNSSHTSEHHVGEDEELLACWNEGMLSLNEMRDFRAHLSVCAECRAKVAGMIRDGVLTFSGETAAEGTLPDESQPAPADARTIVHSVKGRQRVRWIGTISAIAACLLIALFLWRPGRNPESSVAMLQKLLDSRDYETAYRQALNVLDEPQVIQDRDQVQLVVEKSAYELARGRLTNGDFAAVREISKEVATRDIASGRIVNLDIQAERHVASESSLQEFGSLLAYGYTLDGRLLTKSLPTLSESTEKLLSETRDASESFPKESFLKLNRGQLLLSLGNPEEARREFDAARIAASTVPDVELGLGLAAFQRGSPQEALSYFENILRDAPNHFNALLNRAVCLEALGRTADASAVWREIVSKTNDDSLRMQINQHLGNSPDP